MNQESSTELKWADDMPENFNPQEFKQELAYVCQTVANMIEDDGNEILYDFFPKVLHALVTHEAFNNWSNSTRDKVITHWDCLRFIVEKLCEVFTPEINESTFGVSKFIESLVIPASPTQH